MKPAVFLLLLSPIPCQAAVFRGQAFMEFWVSTLATRVIPVDVQISTDYSTMSWELSWDVPELYRARDSRGFERSSGTRGRIWLETPLELEPPDAIGIIEARSSRIAYDAEFFGIDEYPYNESWHTSQQGGVTTRYSHYLWVEDYPDHITLAVSLPSPFIWRATTTDGNSRSLIGQLYISESLVHEGIASDFVETVAGDFNGDSIVDAADYTIARDANDPLTALMTSVAVWQDNYGATAPTNSAAIPEPTTATLLILGVMGGAMRRCCKVIGMRQYYQSAIL